MRTYEEYERILTLWERGYTKLAISEITDIPRATVRDCINKFETLENLQQQKDKEAGRSWRTRLQDDNYRKRYAYLLGLYLGDGHISKIRYTYRLRIFQDSRYTNLIELCKETIQVIVPDNTVNVHKKSEYHNCHIISAYSSDWVEMFPQHGEAKKHQRTIQLEEWQQIIVDEFLIEFVKGLYHSDGTRIEPVINNTVYPRYQFVQVSTDIRNLFTDSLRKLGISWTFYGNTVTIAKRRDVAFLDQVLGPKS
jgi:uncharacterized protein YqiB (DUF1249 family)